MENKMEKNSMEIFDKALDLLKSQTPDRPDLALATMVGYCAASVDLKTAQFILSLAESRGN